MEKYNNEVQNKIFLLQSYSVFFLLKTNSSQNRLNSFNTHTFYRFRNYFMQKIKKPSSKSYGKSKNQNLSFAFFQPKIQQNINSLITMIDVNHQNSGISQSSLNPHKQTQILKKQFSQKLLFKTQSQKKASFIIQKPMMYFNHANRVSENKEQILKKPAPSKQNKQCNFLIKKHNSNLCKNTKLLKDSTLNSKDNGKKDFQNSLKCILNEFKEVQNLQKVKSQVKNYKEGIYYCEKLIQEIGKINLQSEINGEKKSSQVINHFFRSFSTFNRYQRIKISDEPHMNVFVLSSRRSTHKNTLIFDLDETLVHAQSYKDQIHNQKLNWGQNFDFTAQDGSVIKINMKIRPYAIQVLKRLKINFQIGLFTAANQTYARHIIKKMDAQGNLFDFCLFRQHCHIVDNKLAIKDLRILSNRSLKKVVLIDNSPHAYLYQPENAIPIIDFYHNKQDNWMLELQSFLITQKLYQKDDVRPVLKQTFQFHKYCDFKDIDQLVQNLYNN